jgi:outer membrane protein assembly factor BamD
MLGWKMKANRVLAALLAGLALLLSGCGSVQRDPTAKWDADRLYKEAKEEMMVGNWQRTRELLEKIDSRFPFTRHAQQAQIEIAYSYYKEGDAAQAITACERFLKLNPNHPNADYVQYLKGLASFNDDLGLFGRFLGQDPSTRDPKAMREAFDAFRELALRWPDSKYAADSRQRMNYLINAMAQSEVNVARYYLSRGAYIAAIQRAQGALRDYQAAPAAAEALSILVRSYDALGLPELRDDAQRVLQKNFPNAPLAARR